MKARTRATTLLSACAIGLVACGEDKPASTRSATTAAQQTSGSFAATARSCPDVQVPGHLAEDVMARGLTCDATVSIARTAEGRRRAAYSGNGFACEPDDAADGKTNYTCTKGDARLTFLYG